MENLGYRLLPLWTEELIGDALEEMERAGRYASRRAGHSLPQTQAPDIKADFSSKAAWSVERQLTPADTPISENIRCTAHLTPETSRAFGVDHGIMGQNMALPNRIVSEAFPLYSEPFLDS